MGEVAKEVVERAGIDVEKLLELLVKAASAEFTTYYYYTILRAHTTGTEGESIKEVVEDARLEDRLHFETLVPRIYELGGDLPKDIKEFAKMAACKDAYLPEEITLKNILRSYSTQKDVQLKYTLRSATTPTEKTIEPTTCP